jgi:hypothetical protein
VVSRIGNCCWAQWCATVKTRAWSAAVFWICSCKQLENWKRQLRSSSYTKRWRNACLIGDGNYRSRGFTRRFGRQEIPDSFRDFMVKRDSGEFQNSERDFPGDGMKEHWPNIGSKKDAKCWEGTSNLDVFFSPKGEISASAVLCLMRTVQIGEKNEGVRTVF